MTIDDSGRKQRGMFDDTQQTAQEGGKSARKRFSGWFYIKDAKTSRIWCVDEFLGEPDYLTVDLGDNRIIRFSSRCLARRVAMRNAGVVRRLP